MCDNAAAAKLKTVCCAAMKLDRTEQNRMKLLAPEDSDEAPDSSGT